MNDPMRVGPRGARRLDADVQQSRYSRNAERTIRCDSPICHCPARGIGSHGFAYVDEERRFIYFAVPKSGSTTLLHHFFGERHPSRHLVDPRRDLDHYLTFTFVRDPWARMVSNWQMFTTDPAARTHLRAMAGGDIADLSTFPAFVQFARDTANHHWQPQVLFLPEALDVVGKLETFDDDFDRVCAAIGAPPAAAERRRTGGDASQYRQHYTPELAGTVGEMYSADVERFGYAFA